MAMAREDPPRTCIKNRRRTLATDHNRTRIAVDGKVDTVKEFDHPWCKRHNVSSSPSLDVTASTASMNMSFDTSFNSNHAEFQSPVMGPPPVAADDGCCSTPVNNKSVRFDTTFDNENCASMKENMSHNYQSLMQLQINSSAPIVSPTTPMKSRDNGWPSWAKMALTPEKDDQMPEHDWDPFKCDEVVDTTAASPPKIPNYKSPLGSIDMNSSSYTRKGSDVAKTSRSSSANNASAVKDLLRSLRDENERLKNEIKETSEEAGTLDASYALVADENARGNSHDDDDYAVEEGTITTSVYEETIDTGIVDEAATLTTDFYTVDEGTASYYSRSQIDDWDDGDDGTEESDFESVTLESIESPWRPKRRSTRTTITVKAGPSSPTLRQALRRQNKTAGDVSFSCPPVFEELKGTYEDASNAFYQVLNAFFVSPDDVDKTSEAITEVKKELCVSHTDKFVPKTTTACTP